MVKYTSYFFYGSVAAVILSAIGALGIDLWLASTQWLIVAVVLAVWAMYVKDENNQPSV